jgi:hypothetical protein
MSVVGACLVVSPGPGCHFHGVHNFFDIHHLEDSERIPYAQPDVPQYGEVNIVEGVNSHPTKDTCQEGRDW